MIDQEIDIADFKAIKLKLASPEDILEWSHGEVVKPETINYRTQRPEKDGLFCEKIFGPSKDWECSCGKYKHIRYKGVVCDRCGVEVTRSIVRRERMGHIKLAVPVSHIWFLRGVPSSIGLFLGKTPQELEKVIYFAAYIVTEVNETARLASLKEIRNTYKTKIKNADSNQEKTDFVEGQVQAIEEIQSIQPMKVISEVQFRNLSLKYGSIFKAGIGAEAIRDVLKNIRLEQLAEHLKKEMEKINSSSPEKLYKSATSKKIIKRLKIVESFIKVGLRPEWMCPVVLPVIPPDLRPMVQLDGGRFATSDLNDLYRRVINRNNRLKRLIELGAPEVICRNEKRMLQEAVDALIDNSSRHGTTVVTGKRRQLKSLADMLKGKQGRFRQNLLGKRVDYSGRSVIVVGSDLKLSECGLPKIMALELFKPFIIKSLIKQGYAYNVRSAARLIEEREPVVWDILEEETNQRYVLLNRAPTLHRLGIQAFKPILIEGKAIQIHPMVCKAFNADFDGDQMAVHLPLTEEAQKEAKEIMLSIYNLLKPATGEPIVIPTQDIVLGCYWLTKTQKGLKGEGKNFSSEEEAILTHQYKKIDLGALIKLRKKPGEFIETSVGRIIFNQALPKELEFTNETINSSKLKSLVAVSFEKCGREQTVEFVDRIKDLGFRYATYSGISWGMDDILIPKSKDEALKKASEKVNLIHNQYKEGLLTDAERRIRIIEVWSETKNKVSEAVSKSLDEYSPVYSMIDSGARGNWAVVTQMGGMKGLVVNPAGETIELPIKSSFKEGFNVLEYFISTHGTRKGMADIALRTASAGYLTRRLVDVSQDVVIREKDCRDKEGVWISRSEEGVANFTDRIVGRYALENINDPKTEKVIVKKNEIITKEKAEEIDKLNISKVHIRSIITCKALRGVCQKCYGYDLGKNQPVEIGEAVGIITAQAIGEPGTQLTMKTFHTGGVAGKDITQGLPRVEEIFEARVPKVKALISEVDGVVENVVEEDNKKVIRIYIKDPQGKEKKEVKQYSVSKDTVLWVEKGNVIKKSDQLTEGHLDLHELFKIGGEQAIRHYIISEIQQIYSAQGEGINDKHLEVIIRQMFSRVNVKNPGDTNLLFDDIVTKSQFREANIKVKEKGGVEATAEPLLLGITKASLSTESWLSAASFQETARVLIKASITGREDTLRGLKENVIIGKLIPAGTGFKK
jgi:DNA-directed RNA polymerase subunit beta'